jgi:hypothetical protein
MRRFSNDLEPQRLAQRIYLESQCYVDSTSSCGNVMSRRTISAHSFDRQPTKAIALTVEEIAAKSESAILQSLNSIDGVHTVSMFIMISVMGWSTSALDI